MKHTEIPHIIEEVGFDFDWDEEDVWKLDYPIDIMENKGRYLILDGLPRLLNIKF